MRRLWKGGAYFNVDTKGAHTFIRGQGSPAVITGNSVCFMNFLVTFLFTVVTHYLLKSTYLLST